MHIKRMHEMQECLTEKALSELEKGTDHVDTCEMGQVVDMIKDLAEAEYRATITKAMEEAKEEEEEYDKILLRELKEEYGEDTGRRFYDHYRYADGRFAPKGHGTYRRGYEEPPYWHMTPDRYHDMEHSRDMDKGNGRMYYTEPTHMESRYESAKRAYTESKELHKGNDPQDKEAKMRELEKYMKEMSDDLLNLMKGMSQEEMNMAKSKLSVLVSKM
nr:MAG TPA: hypothetical protein [Caudoviricetes sp.]